MRRSAQIEAGQRGGHGPLGGRRRDRAVEDPEDPLSRLARSGVAPDLGVTTIGHGPSPLAPDVLEQLDSLRPRIGHHHGFESLTVFEVAGADDDVKAIGQIRADLSVTVDEAGADPEAVIQLIDGVGEQPHGQPLLHLLLLAGSRRGRGGLPRRLGALLLTTSPALLAIALCGAPVVGAGAGAAGAALGGDRDALLLLGVQAGGEGLAVALESALDLLAVPPAQLVVGAAVLAPLVDAVDGLEESADRGDRQLGLHDAAGAGVAHPLRHDLVPDHVAGTLPLVEEEGGLRLEPLGELAAVRLLRRGVLQGAVQAVHRHAEGLEALLVQLRPPLGDQHGGEAVLLLAVVGVGADDDAVEAAVAGPGLKPEAVGVLNLRRVDDTDADRAGALALRGHGKGAEQARVGAGRAAAEGEKLLLGVAQGVPEEAVGGGTVVAALNGVADGGPERQPQGADDVLEGLGGSGAGAVTGVGVAGHGNLTCIHTGLPCGCIRTSLGLDDRSVKSVLDRLGFFRGTIGKIELHLCAHQSLSRFNTDGIVSVFVFSPFLS